MKDYKRLTERITASNTGRIVLIIPSFRHEIIKQTNRLADLEDKIESGELCDRKEVRKETAMDILQIIKDSAHIHFAMREIAKKYGVNLEEQ